MHCAITQYIQWVRAQTQSPDPEVKARKLKEIDTLCGSSLQSTNVQSGHEAQLSAAQTTKPPAAPKVIPTPSGPASTPATSRKTAPTAASATGNEFPRVPEKHLPLLKAIPRHGEFVVEVGESVGRFDPEGMNYRSDLSTFDLAARKEYRWDLPPAILDGLAPQSSLHRASWAPQTSNLLFAKLNEAFLISKDGAARALSLQMPGHLGQVVVLNRSGKQLLSIQAGTAPGPSGFSGEMIWDLKWQPDGQQMGILIYPTRRLCLMDEKGTLKKVEIKSTGLFKKEITVNSFTWSP
jgi:hypothetical protein